MQSRYFEFATGFYNLYTTIRNIAVKYNQNLAIYPVFGLYMDKAGNKFLETLLKMMIGQKTKISAPDFTRSTIENLKRNVMVR